MSSPRADDRHPPHPCPGGVACGDYRPAMRSIALVRSPRKVGVRGRTWTRRRRLRHAGSLRSPPPMTVASVRKRQTLVNCASCAHSGTCRAGSGAAASRPKPVGGRDPPAHCSWPRAPTNRSGHPAGAGYTLARMSDGSFMGSRSWISARCFGRRVPGAVWLGLLAVVLHVGTPLMAPAFSSAASAGHAHDHATHSHDERASESAADPAPLDPDHFCVGDCPWLTPSDRPQPLPSRTQSALLPVGTAIISVPVTSSLPRIFQPGTHTRPRAPPPLS